MDSVRLFFCLLLLSSQLVFAGGNKGAAQASSSTTQNNAQVVAQLKGALQSIDAVMPGDKPTQGILKFVLPTSLSSSCQGLLTHEQSRSLQYSISKLNSADGFSFMGLAAICPMTALTLPFALGFQKMSMIREIKPLLHEALKEAEKKA